MGETSNEIYGMVLWKFLPSMEIPSIRMEESTNGMQQISCWSKISVETNSGYHRLPSCNGNLTGLLYGRVNIDCFREHRIYDYVIELQSDDTLRSRPTTWISRLVETFNIRQTSIHHVDYPSACQPASQVSHQPVSLSIGTLISHTVDAQVASSASLSTSQAI